MMLSTALCLVYLMETKHLRIGERIRKSGQCEMKEIHDPMAGNTIQRIVHTNTGSIVIKNQNFRQSFTVTMTKVKVMAH